MASAKKQEDDLSKLNPIYEFKEQKQRNKRNEKSIEIRKIEKEIAEREGKVNGLKNKIVNARNNQLEMERQTGGKVASSYLVSVDKFISIVAYDVEKETFYLNMTYGELELAKHELSVINKDLVKIENKSKLIASKLSKLRSVREDKQQENESEEFSSKPKFG